jgi:hypothetical protein
MAGPEVGVQVACPSCDQTVFQHGMIPILAEDGSGVRYVCRACARALIDTAQTGDGAAGTAATDGGAPVAAAQ